MSVAEGVSMAMAELLVVMFEGGRTTWQDICWPKDDFLEKKSVSWLGVVVLVMTVVMLIKGHHVEVGVGVLPS